MKTNFPLHVEQEFADEIRGHAIRLGVSLSNLFVMLADSGLKRTPPEEMKRWAAVQGPPRGPSLSGAPPKAERTVIAAFERLLKNDEGAWRFSHQEVARESGMTAKAAYMALKALQERGLLVGADSEQVDRWGRPVESFWRRADHAS